MISMSPVGRLAPGNFGKEKLISTILFLEL